MSESTPDDDAGIRVVLNARADEVFMHAGITGDPSTRADAERLRALASGDIHAARLALAEIQLDEALEELHEVRAEVDSLRAENDALADHNSQLRHGMETAISDHAALRSAVAGVLGEWDADPDGRLGRGSAFARALRAILATGSAS